MELRGAEGVSLFVGRVGVSFLTTESLSERDDIETGQVKARHTGSVFEHAKGLQDRIRAVPHPLRGMPAGVGRQFRIDDALDPAAAAQGGRESARDSPDAKAGPARKCCIAGVLGCNARRGDQPSTEEFGPPLTGVGPDEATTPTSRR